MREAPSLKFAMQPGVIVRHHADSSQTVGVAGTTLF